MTDPKDFDFERFVRMTNISQIGGLICCCLRKNVSRDNLIKNIYLSLQMYNQTSLNTSNDMGLFKDIGDWFRSRRINKKEEELSDRINALKQEERRLNKDLMALKEVTIDVSWFRLTHIAPHSPNFIIFTPINHPSVTTMKDLEGKREEEEKKRRAQLHQTVESCLSTVSSLIKQRKLDNAEQLLATVLSTIKILDDGALNISYASLVQSITDTRDKIRDEEIKRQEKEERDREKVERLRREEERKRIEKAQEEKEEKEKRAREYEEKLQKEEQERQLEVERLKAIVTCKKSEPESFLQYLRLNHVTCFYHFTDKLNLPSIRRLGGLYSWFYCEQHGIEIPNPGGDHDSRRYDSQYGLQDFVRLSFCDDHPMAWRKKQNGAELVLLKVSIDVATFRDTLFSDVNAAARDHSHGAELDDLKRVNIAATKQHYVSRTDPIFHEHQAEILVKTFIPLEYILNIDNPIRM